MPTLASQAVDQVRDAAHLLSGHGAYREKTDLEAAHAARRRYSCFEDFGEDPQSYGLIASADRSLSCEEEVVQQLVELQNNAAQFLSRDGPVAADELFYAEQNARVAQNAEKYHRSDLPETYPIGV